MNIKTYLLLLLLAGIAEAQVQQVPYYESFDSLVTPALPSGWTTTTNRSVSGDFTTTSSTTKSLPNAVLSTNSKVSQSLISPLLDFTDKQADSLIFYERRSTSHNSGLLVEASLDSGKTFPLIIGDTLKNPGVTTYIDRRLKLPALLDNQSSVKIRWRVVGNGTGSTGTIRFDNDSIRAIANLDAGVSSISFLPLLPVAGDSVFINAVIRNFGLYSIQNISVEFYRDINGDSVPQLNERLATKNILPPLAPNDTTAVTLKVTNVALGQHVFIVKTSFSNDQNSENDIHYSMLSVGLPHYSIVVNEIMYAPTGSEPEWIELFNTTDSVIDLRNWRISNRNVTSQYIISQSSALLGAKDLVVVTKDTARFDSAHIGNSIHLVETPSLPSYLFNNGGDGVVLFDQRGAMMDSVHYMPSWGGSNGTSLERIEPNSSSIDSTNWSSSIDMSGSSPGQQNSLTPVDYDLSVIRVSTISFSQTSTAISVIVKNVGRFPASNFSVSVYVDANEDSTAQASERLDSMYSSFLLARKDSITIPFTWTNSLSGKQLLIVRIDYAQDLRLSNNLLIASVGVSFPPNSIIINEIMYQPQTGQSEWVELYNRSTDSVNLDGWNIHDRRDNLGNANVFLVGNSKLNLKPEEFLLISADSSILQNLRDSTLHVIILHRNSMNLNDDGDDVVLTDLTGKIIDSVRYTPNWHNQNVASTIGRSLERINLNVSGNDPRNWSTSAGSPGGTPGRQNSIFTTSVASSASLAFSPNPFSPDGDGFEDFTIISYELPTTAASVRIRIFDAKGRLIRTLANGEPSGAHGQIIWDGFDDSREKARIGIYIVLLDALDANGGIVQTTKGVVVLAVKL